MSLDSPIARNLDEPTRIMGLAPTELASCAVIYAVINTVLRGVPFSALLSLGAGIVLGGVLILLNRTFPQNHGLYWLMRVLRPRVVSVMPWGTDEKELKKGLSHERS